MFYFKRFPDLGDQGMLPIAIFFFDDASYLSPYFFYMINIWTVGDSQENRRSSSDNILTLHLIGKI
jgi:hypothetical protein